MDTLTVFSRTGCHLCDEMLFVLRQLQKRHLFQLTVENVDTQPAWQQQHGQRVPVLIAERNNQQTELCWGRIDDDAVTAWLSAGESATASR